MNCRNQITYVIRPGDTLFRIAAFYHTTIDEIIKMNPGIDPLNLQIGSAITVCVGDSFFEPPIAFPTPPIGTLPPIGVVPPIGTVPPVTPVPPIGIIPPCSIDIEQLAQSIANRLSELLDCRFRR